MTLSEYEKIDLSDYRNLGETALSQLKLLMERISLQRESLIGDLEQARSDMEESDVNGVLKADVLYKIFKKYLKEITDPLLEIKQALGMESISNPTSEIGELYHVISKIIYYEWQLQTPYTHSIFQEYIQPIEAQVYIDF